MEDAAVMQIQPEYNSTSAEISVPETNQGREQELTNPLGYGGDILRIIMSFVRDDAYLFVASVSTQWRDGWGQRRAVTNPRCAVQSCSCFNWARACGLSVWDRPCLHAAAEGRLDVLQHLVALGYAPECMPICEHAAGGGHLEVVQWSRANGYPWGQSSSRAAEGGHLEVLQWCLANGCPLSVGKSCRGDTNGVITQAVSGGHLETVRWCREQGHPWPSEACLAAAAGGHFELLKWLRANDCPWSQRTMDAAVAAGTLEVLEWCRANGCPWSRTVCHSAAQYGNLENLRWCIDKEKRSDKPADLCRIAASFGHLEIVKWLRANGYSWGRFVCYAAASNGHEGVLKWCVENGCPWDSTIPRDSFKSTVPTMLWAMANKCPWMDLEADFHHICQQAAAGGNLNVLQWCGMYRALNIAKVSRAAASKGHIHILEWLRVSGWLSDRRTLDWLQSHGSLSAAETDSRLCQIGAKAGCLEVIKWCRANKYPWDKGTCKAAAYNGNLKLLEWSSANGCPWDKEAYEHVVGYGHFEMLAWCRANNCPLNFTSVHTWATVRGFGEMAQWCKTHACLSVEGAESGSREDSRISPETFC